MITLRSLAAKVLYSLPLLNSAKKRTIKTGPVKGFAYFGTFRERKYFTDAFEADIIRFIKSRSVGGNAYDIGAHFGFYAMVFSQLVPTDGSVYSFEPNPETFERLKKNLQLNGLEGEVEIRNIALGEKSGIAELAVVVDNVARSTLNEDLKQHYEGKKIKKQTVRIERLDDLNLPEPAFVKIDVEGFEVPVLKGMRQILDEAAPDMIVEIHGAGEANQRETMQQVLKILWSHGYSCMNIERNQYLGAFEDISEPNGHIYASKDQERILSACRT